MSLSPSHGTERPVITQRGRNRVCKHCKFSSTYAKAFYKHQVTAHGDSQVDLGADNIFAGDNEETRPDQDSTNAVKPERARCDSGDLHADHTSALYNSDTETSVVDEDVMNSPIMQLSSHHNDFATDTANNNEIRSKAAFLENNPDYPETKSTATDGNNRSPSQKRSNFGQDNDPKNSSARESDETNDEASGLVIDEGESQEKKQKGHSNSPGDVMNMYTTPYINITPENDQNTGDNSRDSLSLTSPTPLSTHSLLNQEHFSSEAVSQGPVFPGLTNIQTTPTKTTYNKSGNASNVTPGRRCAPVREAVDPAKYITVQEGDGVKYACSKCGNIYKWRKSLNKHWKEKHDGDIPEPRSNAASNLPSLPRLGVNAVSNSRMRHSEQSTGRSVTQRASPSSATRHESPYLTTLAMGQGNYLSSALAKFDHKNNESFFSSLRSSDFKSSPSPKQRSTQLPYYRSSPNRKSSLVSPAVLDYLKMQQKLVSSWLPSREKEHNSSALSPPTAHSMKSALLYGSLPSPTETGAMDLGKGSKRSFVEQGDVLDLSVKTPPVSTRKATQIKSPVDADTPCQDEPLDLSMSSKKPGKEPRLTSHNKPVFNTYKPVSFDIGSSLIKQSQAQLKQCKLCTYMTREERDMEIHMQLHASSDITCYECKEIFGSIEDLNQHFVLRHMQVLAKRMAQVRSEKAAAEAKAASSGGSTSGDHLYKYLMQSSSRQNTNCIVCGATYQFLWALTRHFEQEHATMPNPYQIPDSPSPDNASSPVPVILSQISSLNKSSNEGEEEQKFSCPQCSYIAGSSSELAKHKLFHSADKSAHACKICSYTAQTQEALLDHYAKEHPEVQPRDLETPTGMDDYSESDSLHGNTDSGATTRIIAPDGKSVIDLGDDTHHTAIVFPQAPEDTSKGNGSSKGGTASVHTLLPYKCSVCDYRARWPSEITQHMKNHSDEKPFCCPRCTYRSKWKWDVVKHLKRCGGGTIKDVIDITKGARYLSSPHGVENLAPSHARELSNGPPNVTVLPNNAHNSGKTTPSMEHCRFELYGSDDSMAYANSPTDSGSLECNECSYVASSVHDMRNHTKLHGFDSQQVYCPQCPFIGLNQAELKRHMRVHSDEKRFLCKSCGYRSKWKCDLKKHCRTYNHTPATPLTYGGHGRKLKEGSEINGEMSDHGESDDQMGLSPDECSTDGYSPNALDNSIKDEHNTEGRYQCEKCTYSTDSESALVSHEQMHNSDDGIPPYNCLTCDYITDDWMSFQQHKLLHPGMYETTSHATDAVENDSGEPNAGNRRKQAKTNIMKNKHEMGFPLHSPENGLMNGSEGATDLSTSKPTKTPTNTLSCGHCSFTTNNYQNYERHLATHIKPEARFSCDWCGWTSEQMHNLYRHAQVAHPQHLKDLGDKETFYDRVKDRFLYSVDKGKWQGSPYNTSPSISPVQSPLTARPVYSEGKKTKRRLKTCGKCGYITDNVTTLQRHMTKHGKMGKYTCTQCDYSVDKQHVLEYHMRLVHLAKQDLSLVPSPARMAPSSIEGDNTSNSTVEFNDSASVELDNDISSGADNGDTIVDFDNADVSSLRGEDVKIVHIGNRTVYGCTKCSYNTMKVSSVLGHTRQHGAQKRYTCTSCDYSADHRAHVASHMRAIHGDHREPIVTGHCNIAMDKTNDDHYDSNNQERLFDAPDAKRPRLELNNSSPFACSKCPFEGANMTELVGHKCRTDQQLRCNYCDYTTSSENLLKLHLTIHIHTEVKESSHNSPKHMFYCDKCPYSTYSRPQVESHKSRHDVRSKEDCPYCDYSCANNMHLANHMKVHFPGHELEKDVLNALARGEEIHGMQPILGPIDTSRDTFEMSRDNEETV